MAQTATAAPTTTPIYKRWWFWVLVAVVAVIAIATSQGGDDGATGATPSTGGAQSAAPAAPEAATPEAEAEAPADDPLTDDGWTVSDIQVENSQFGTAVTARVTNNETATRTGVWTLTIFSGGQRIYEAMGSGSDVEAGQTATVTFVGSTETLPGDPASYTYEFQSDI